MSSAPLSIVRIIGAEPFWPTAICNLLKEHGVGELCDPGKPLEDLNTVPSVESAWSKTTADTGVCVILEDPSAGCMQHLLDNSIRHGANLQDLCIARFHTQWSTGEFSGSEEAFKIFRSFTACRHPLGKPLHDDNTLVPHWKRQIDICALQMLGFSKGSLKLRFGGTPRLASTGCSIDEACIGMTSCRSLVPASRAHIRALRYVYSTPLGEGINVKSMRTFVEQ